LDFLRAKIASALILGKQAPVNTERQAMNEPHDPNETVDDSSAPADSLDAGLAAGFGRRVDGPASVLSALGSTLGSMKPVFLKEAQGESAVVVKPGSDAMPSKDQAGDRYQLSGEIARGGMGAVLRGRDVDLGRDLAVKVLLEKYVDRPEVARRFIEEAQIGGQLQHPGVVPVYDIGRFGDRPFFTMKLVKGQTLSALLAERTEPAADRPRLLGIALQVAQAVAYAHAKGVIHRDLKPANIMVGAFGEVQVMDWGLAKVLAEGGVADEERASRAHQVPEDVTTIRTARSTGSLGSFGTDTEAGSILGTLAYMPPEQANGDIAHLDRRADVFGLGAILCEILTGKPPYVGRSGEEVRRKACNGDLAEAMARLDGSGADQQLIALTKGCLAADASDRPKDGQEVADGMSAYLASVQERVQVAERERAVAEARAIEERRRRRVQLALAAALVALTALGGLGTTSYLQQRAAQVAAGQRVIDQVTTLQKQALDHPEETGRWAIALAAVEQADPAGDPKSRALLVVLQKEIEDGFNAAKRDRALLDRLVDIRSAEADDPDGSVSDNDYADAFRAAGIDLAGLTPEEAGARIRARPPSIALALAAALDDWAAIRRRWRHDPANAALLSEAARACDPDPWRIKLRTAFEQPDMQARRAALRALAQKANFDDLSPISLHLLGSGLEGFGESELAESVLRKAQQRHPGDVWVNYTLARVLAKQSRGDEAIRFYTAARAIRPETAHGLGHALEKRGDRDEAIAVFRDLAALRPGIAEHLSCLGHALKQSGRKREARETFELAVVAGREAVRLKPDSRSAHDGLGYALQAKGQWDEAIASYKKAIELNMNSPRAHFYLGVILFDQKRDYDGAIACFRKAIELNPKAAIAHNNLGSALAIKGQFDEAIDCFKKAIELDPNQANALSNLAAAKRMAPGPEQLTSFLDGKYTPVSNGERLSLAKLCGPRKLNHTAAGLYAAAFAADPKLADDMRTGRRYNAACFAALAAAGQGEDAAKLDDNERRRLRQQALDWLKANLTFWGNRFNSGPPQPRPGLVKVLSRWQEDPDLAGIRDAAALAKLPADEQKAFTQFWADVAVMLKKAQTPATKEAIK
jgi:eukaryotic-like serine/threonine-protein kinase